MNRREVIIIILSVIIILFGSLAYNSSVSRSVVKYVDKYTDLCYSIERGYIESIPIYRDYATPAFIRELQKFNLKDHFTQVVKTGIKPLHNEKEIMENVKAGRLVEVNSENKLFYFYNVRKQYRYLTPKTIEGLNLVTERFQQKIRSHRKDLPQVKIAISSVIRTVDYQEKVFGRKFVSSHSFGGCFDIFFEDYFVVVPDPQSGNGTEESIGDLLHKRFGFLMGDALREQFRTILMETLIELQREGVLYAFLENDNRCYHITILSR